jgi:hypothetical protein
MKLSLDAQLVRPAQRQAATGEAEGGEASTKHVDTAKVLGVRLQLII